MKKYDLVVIGGGPAGEKASVRAAYFDKKVALIENRKDPGGAGVHTGTLPSKTLREAALYFSGKRDTGLFGIDRDLKRSLSIDDFFYRKNFVTSSEVEQINANIAKHKVQRYYGKGVFEDEHRVRIIGGKEEVIYGDYILIATGSYPYHPDTIPFDEDRIHDSDSILNLNRFPKSLCIVGAGVIGCEYATIFSTLGTEVFLVDSKDTILPFVDREVTEHLIEQMRHEGVDITFKTGIADIEIPDSEDEMIRVELKTGEIINADMLLYAAGRSGNTNGLKLEHTGVMLGKRQSIVVDQEYRTSVPHIFAAGDVIGFPALASTSMDQGRAAVAHMFGLEAADRVSQFFPYGIYTDPEISMVGLTEEEAQDQTINYAVGKAYYTEMARGKIVGAQHGFLKLLFSRDDLRIIGVHIIGNLATEIIHYGVTLVEHKKKLREVLGTVFNYPTFHDLYKYAAYNGLGVVRGRGNVDKE